MTDYPGCKNENTNNAIISLLVMQCCMAGRRPTSMLSVVANDSARAVSAAVRNGQPRSTTAVTATLSARAGHRPRAWGDVSPGNYENPRAFFPEVDNHVSIHIAFLYDRAGYRLRFELKGLNRDFRIFKNR